MKKSREKDKTRTVSFLISQGKEAAGVCGLFSRREEKGKEGSGRSAAASPSLRAGLAKKREKLGGTLFLSGAKEGKDPSAI